jgi:membrane protein involved in colicin uptake
MPTDAEKKKAAEAAAAKKRKIAADKAALEKKAAAKKALLEKLKKSNVDLNDPKFVAKKVTKNKPKDKGPRKVSSSTQLNFGGTRLGSVTKLNRKKGGKSYRA